MPDFRRLGQPPFGYRRYRGFGRGQNPGFRWIRSITFEAGALVSDPTGFDATAGANLDVTAAAAIRGNFGFAVTIPNDGANRFGQILNINNLTTFSLQFLLDPNSITMPSGPVMDIVRTGSSGPGGVSLLVEFGFLAGTGYRARGVLRTDAPAGVQTAYIVVPDEASQFLVEWQASDGSDNGLLNFCVNGQQESITGQDNDQQDVTFLRTGGAFGVDAGTNGTFYMDNIRYASRLR